MEHDRFPGITPEIKSLNRNMDIMRKRFKVYVENVEQLKKNREVAKQLEAVERPVVVD